MSRDDYLQRLTAIVESVARSDGLPVGAVRRERASVRVAARNQTPLEFTGQTGASDEELNALVRYYLSEVAPRSEAASISVNTYALDHQTAHDLIQSDRLDLEGTRQIDLRSDQLRGGGWFAYAPNTGVTFHPEFRWRRMIGRLRRRR